MNYDIKMGAFAIACLDQDTRGIGPVPGTEFQIQMSTDSDKGRDIWFGYLQMQADQKKKPPAPESFFRIRLDESAEEKRKFEEAINVFFRFMAGHGRDNWLQVVSIAPAVAPMPPEQLHMAWRKVAAYS